jgi:hypothetical protein
MILEGFTFYAFLHIVLIEVASLNHWKLTDPVSRYSPPFHLSMETDPVSETLCSVQNTGWWTVKTTSNANCNNILLSEHFGISI